jgi:hypothetical protein
MSEKDQHAFTEKKFQGDESDDTISLYTTSST